MKKQRLGCLTQFPRALNSKKMKERIIAGYLFKDNGINKFMSSNMITEAIKMRSKHWYHTPKNCCHDAHQSTSQAPCAQRLTVYWPEIIGLNNDEQSKTNKIFRFIPSNPQVLAEMQGKFTPKNKRMAKY